MAWRQRIGEFSKWWLVGLLYLLPARTRERVVLHPDRLSVRVQRDGFSFAYRAGVTDAILAETQLQRGDGTGIAAFQQWLAQHVAGNAIVELLVPPEKALIKTLSLPLAAADNLAEILRLDMDRQTPFTAEQVYFGYAPQGSSAAKPGLAVRLAVVRRDYLDGLMEELRLLNLEVTEVGVDAAEAQGIKLHIGGRSPGTEVRSGRIRILAGAAFALFLLALYAPLLRQDAALAQWETNVAQSRKLAADARLLAGEKTRLIARSGFLAAQRQSRVPFIETLNELTTLLPDHSSLGRLVLRGSEIQLHGESTAATSVLQLIEDSPRFEQAQFRAPLTRNEATGKERFQISANLVRGAVP